MGFQAGRIARPFTTRFKRIGPPRCQTSMETEVTSRPPAPFTSTSYLMQQRGQHREQATCPPIFGVNVGELRICQYGSNLNNMIACCSFVGNSHDQDCTYQSQADHPVIIGLLATPSWNHSPHHHHHSSNGAISSDSRKKRPVEALGEHERGSERVKHRRSKSVESVQDDNFLMLQARASSAKTLDEIIDGDLVKNFCGLVV